MLYNDIGKHLFYMDIGYIYILSNMSNLFRKKHSKDEKEALNVKCDWVGKLSFIKKLQNCQVSGGRIIHESIYILSQSAL